MTTPDPSRLGRSGDTRVQERTMTDARADLSAIEAERARIRTAHLRPSGERPSSTARGLHHLAISVEPSRWQEIIDRFDAAGREYVIHSGVSVYCRAPDGARIELIADPLGEMYGEKVLG